jgi:hypothetical protein
MEVQMALLVEAFVEVQEGVPVEVELVVPESRQWFLGRDSACPSMGLMEELLLVRRELD